MIVIVGLILLVAGGALLFKLCGRGNPGGEL